jgi:phosphatidylserine decarboxylase
MQHALLRVVFSTWGLSSISLAGPRESALFCRVSSRNPQRFKWQLLKSTHFAGELLPVNPRVAYKVMRTKHRVASRSALQVTHISKQVPSLFVRNERACVLGTWGLKRMGDAGIDSFSTDGLKFGMAAVGAYNVGGISLNCNPNLRSNASDDDRRFDGGATRSVLELKPPLLLSPGDAVGCFRIGSTLVLAVEVPDHWNFSFACNSGDKLRVGQALGHIDPAFAATAAAK